MRSPFLKSLWALLHGKQSAQWGRGLSADVLPPLEQRVLVITADRPLSVQQTDQVLDHVRSMAPGWTVLVLPAGFKAAIARATTEQVG